MDSSGGRANNSAGSTGSSSGGLPLIRFLKVEGLSNELKAFMAEAFEISQKIQSEATWITEEECLQINERVAKHYFICAKFEGLAFEHLCRLNYRIFGPQCFCFTFRQAGALPKLPHPVYQISMRGLYVCCSQLAKPVREKVYKKVQWMGGSISREFLAEVTHLVSTDVTSRKYKMAASLGKTVVSPEWVDEAWQLGCSEPLDAADKDFCARFRLQTFQGLTITTTNLTVAERNYVEQTVLANGGTYSGELIRGKCTTLVTNEAKGSKYEAARKWGTALIKTVTMQWLTDSVERGFALDETLYRVPSEGQKVSTPTDDQRRSVVASAFNPDCSAIVPPPSGHRHGNAPNCRLDFNSTTISNASVILRSANGSTSTDVSRVNESTLPPDKSDSGSSTPKRQSKAVAPGAQRKSPGSRASKEPSKVVPSFVAKEKEGKSPGRAAREKDKDGFVRPGAVTLTTKLRKRPDPNTPQASKQLQTSALPEDAAGLSSTSKILDETPIEDLDLSIATSGDFLAKCCVFLSGFERRSADKLRRIVGAGGGKMSATLDKNVTHVLLHTEKRESKHCIEDLNVVRNRKLKCCILLPQWLIHSFKSGQLLPIGKYQLDANGCPLAGTSANLTASSNAPVDSPSGIPRKRTKLKEGSSSTESTPKAGPAVVGQNARKTTVQDEEHVLSQYMPQDSGALGDSTLMRALDDIEGPNGAMHGRENDVEMADNEADKTPAQAASAAAAGDKRVKVVPRYVDPSMETLDPVDMELDRMVEADEDTTVNAAANITEDASTTTSTTANNPNITSDADSERNKSAPVAEVSEARAAPGLFDAKRFYLHGFGADGEDLEAENEVVEHGGTMVDDPDVADFVLCPVVLTPKAATVFSNFQPESVIRSLLWLEMSIEANNLLPGGNNEFFAPYASTAFSSQPLKDCVLSISQYIGRERDFLTDLATKMGAVVQECFARTLRENQLPNTHLLLSKPEGQKFEAAVKWGVHVVNKGWLLETLKAGVRQPEQLYKVCVEQSSADEMDSNERLHLTDDESPQANRAEINAQPCNTNGLAAQSITPLNNRVRALRLSSSTAGRESLGEASFNRGPLPTADDWDTPSKFTDPNKSFHPNFDLGDAMKFLQTPEAERQRRDKDNSMDLGEYLDQQLCLAAQNTAKAPACYGPSVNTDDLRDNAARASTVCNLAMEEERQQQNSYTPILTGPLTGVVMVVSKKLSGQQRELNEMAHKLGAKYLWTYDKSCTHFLFEGRNNDSAKDFRLAKEHGKFVVHSAWLTACKEDNARVDEKLYPHTFSPLRQSQRKPRPTVARIVPSNSQRSSQQSSQEPSAARPNGTSSPVAMATGRSRVTSAVETTPIFRRPTLADLARPLSVNAASALPAALDAAISSPTILAPPKAASMTHLAEKTPCAASRQGSADSNEGDASVVFSQEVMTTVVKRKETAKDIAMDEDKNAPTSPTAADVRFNLNAYLSEVCSNKQNSRKFATNRVNKENKTTDSSVKAAPGGETSNSCDSSAASTSDAAASHPKPVDLLSSGTSLVEWDDPHQRRERQRIGPLIRGRTEATQSLDCDGDVYVPGIADNQDEQQPRDQDDSSNAVVGAKLVTVVEEIDDDISIVAEIPADEGKRKAATSAPSSAASASASRGGEMRTKNSAEMTRKPTTSNEKLLTRGASITGNKTNTASAAPSTFESEMPCAQQHSKPPSPLATPTTTKYRFMLSAFGFNEKAACKDLLETMLGGVILESNNFDPSCTHIIAKTLSKNEKLLAGIATGKWIIQSNYLEACAAAKRFVDEAAYEWTLSKEQPQLASACRLWRLKLAKQNPSGAFHGWRALLCMDGSDREASVRRLLEFGGAIVQSMSASTVSRSDRFTHALLDLEKTPLCKYEDLPTLKSYGIRCFKSSYIAAFLTKDKEELFRL